MEDERLLLSAVRRARRASSQDWKALGVETVRLHAGWYAIAPASAGCASRGASTRTTPLDRRYRWSALDQAVNLVVAAGMKPMLTVTGPAPFWATADSAPAQGPVPARSRATSASSRGPWRGATATASTAT